MREVSRVELGGEFPRNAFTSPTSGTASLERIVRTIAGRDVAMLRVPYPLVDHPVEKGVKATYLDPDANTIYWFQGPRHWRPEIDLSKFKLAVNFRDPRDLACNQYWWALQHPNTHDTPEEAERKRRETEQRGIEKYVLGRNIFDTYTPMLQISESAHGDRTVYTSYAQLCCAFDLLVENLCKLFERDQAEVSKRLEIERPENLTANQDWVKVGGTWKGSDITPGRFKKEISQKGVVKLAEKWRRELDFCKKRDAAFLAWHYD